MAWPWLQRLLLAGCGSAVRSTNFYEAAFSGGEETVGLLLCSVQAAQVGGGVAPEGIQRHRRRVGTVCARRLESCRLGDARHSGPPGKMETVA